MKKIKFKTLILLLLISTQNLLSSENINLSSKMKELFNISILNQAITNNRNNSFENFEKISIYGTPGEIRSASITIKAKKDIYNLKITSTKLINSDESISESFIDIRSVKYWFQGDSRNIGYFRNKSQYFKEGKILKPELLLKDSSLVKVDLQNKLNYIKSVNKNDNTSSYLLGSSSDSSNLDNLMVIDSKELQEITLEENSFQEYWINFTIPENAKAGTYIGNIEITNLNSKKILIPIELLVYPFKLDETNVIYSLYYTSKLNTNNKELTDKKWLYFKSKEQYKNELINMKKHGVLYPVNYHTNINNFEDILKIREEVKLPKKYFFYIELFNNIPKTKEENEKRISKIKKIITLLKKYNYQNIYIYGIDEAEDELFFSQKELWKNIHLIGGKNFVATSSKNTDEKIKEIGSLLDIAILLGDTNNGIAKKWQQIGIKVFSYGNPQVAEELPEIYRLNYGLGLLKAEYDGEMNFAYQYGFNHPWNDFDHIKYRDHMFTYPTIDGVIDTIAWEGFREGIYDVRYITTLKEKILNAPENKSKVAKEASLWINSITPERSNLDEIRKKTIEWILKLI